MALNPTKARLALLADVEAGEVVRLRMPHEDYNRRTRRTVTAQIRAMRTADWVKLGPPAEGDRAERWFLTPAGLGVLNGVTQ